MKKIFLISLAFLFIACSSATNLPKEVHFKLDIEAKDVYTIQTPYHVILSNQEALDGLKSMYIPIDIPYTRSELTNLIGNINMDWKYSVKRGTYYITMIPKVDTPIEVNTELASFDITPREPGYIDISFVNGDLEVLDEEGNNHAALSGHIEPRIEVVEQITEKE